MSQYRQPASANPQAQRRPVNSGQPPRATANPGYSGGRAPSGSDDRRPAQGAGYTGNRQPARTTRSGNGRSGGSGGGSGGNFPRGAVIAIAAMLVLLVIAIVFEQFKPADTALTSGTSVTGNVLDNSPIRISEVMSSNGSAICDENGNYPDWIELVNVSTEPVSLGGLILTDTLTKDKFFALPKVTLQPGEYKVIFASGDNKTDPNAPIHTSFKLSSAGETVYLLDDMGNQLDIAELPAMSRDMAYVRNLSDLTWSVSSEFTPGYANISENHQALLQQNTVTNSPLVINEICASNKTTIPDADGDFNDWIELYNGSSQAINLKGYGLSDDPGKPKQWMFPDVTIQPGAYLVVYASGKSKVTETELHTNFKLGSEKSSVVLCNAQGQVLDKVTYDLIPHDGTYGRDASGNWRTYAQGTPGYANTQESMAIMESALAARNTTGLFFEEALASNSIETDANPNSYDWAELHNRSAQSISLAGYGISDNPANPRKWQFPEGAKIDAGQRIVIYCSGKDTSNVSKGVYHTNFKLSHYGESLTICTPDGTILDKVPMELQYTDVSFGRTSDSSGFFYLTTPTPGSSNNSSASFLGKVEPVTLSQPGGIYADTFTLEMSCADPDAAIYYTVDSTTPTTSSNRYTGPLAVSGTSVVRALAVKDGYMNSYTTTATYLYGISHTMPIISVVTDPDNLFDENTGIMVKGPNATAEFPYGSRGKGANFWMDWEYPASFEYMNSDGTNVLSQNVGIALVGQYSRAEDQKAIGIYARTKYGDDTLSFNPFPNVKFDEYHAVVLRASGQDNEYTRMRDSILTSLAEGTNLIYQDSTPVVVYLNGQYWGHYNLRERINKWFIAQHTGITNKDDIKNIDLIKGNTRVLNGSFSSYKEVLDFVADHDLNNADNLQWVADRIDIDSLFDWVACEMLVANTDTGNIKFYRSTALDSKWKWIFFDLDWALFDMRYYTDSDRYDYVRRTFNDKGHGVSRAFNNRIIMALIDVPEMQDKFLNRMAYLMQHNFNPDTINAKIDEWVAMLEPEMPAQFAKWGGSMETWAKSIATLRSNTSVNFGYLLDALKDYFDLSSDEMTKYFGQIKFN